MKLRLVIVLACALLGLTACVVVPFGDGGRGEYYSDGGGHYDYGHRVWHE